jgi:hypothetical protein
LNKPGQTAQQLNADARELIALGYAQELFRTMGGFSLLIFDHAGGREFEPRQPRHSLCDTTTPGPRRSGVFLLAAAGSSPVDPANILQVSYLHRSDGDSTSGATPEVVRWRFHGKP